MSQKKTPKQPPKRLTLKMVNAALAAENIKAELIQGEGYLYFIGDDMDLAKGTSVSVARLNHLPLDRWLEEARSFKIESQSRAAPPEEKARLKRKFASKEASITTEDPSDTNAVEIKSGRKPVLRDAIEQFIRDLASLSGSKIEARCTAEMQSIAHLRASTRKGYIARYRKAVSDAYGSSHPALSYLTSAGLREEIANEPPKGSVPVILSQSSHLMVADSTKPPSRKMALEAFSTALTSAMAAADPAQAISALWTNEFASTAHLADTTRKLYVSKYYRPAAKAVLGEDSPYLPLIALPADMMDAINRDYRERVISQNRELIHVEHWQSMVERARKIVASVRDRRSLSREQAVEVAAALLLLTGRRPYEIVCCGSLSPASLPGAASGARSKWSVLFSGQSKTRGRDGTNFETAYEIPVLAPANDLLIAFQKLRASPDGEEWTTLTNDEFSSLTNSRGQENILPIRSVATDIFGALWPENDMAFNRRTDRNEVRIKSLRPLYAEIAYKFFASPSVSKNSFFATILGHTSKDLETSLSYFDYYLEENDGNKANTGVNKLKDRIEKRYSEIG